MKKPMPMSSSVLHCSVWSSALILGLIVAGLVLHLILVGGTALWHAVKP